MFEVTIFSHDDSFYLCETLQINPWAREVVRFQDFLSLKIRNPQIQYIYIYIHTKCLSLLEEDRAEIDEFLHNLNPKAILQGPNLNKWLVGGLVPGSLELLGIPFK